MSRSRLAHVSLTSFPGRIPTPSLDCPSTSSPSSMPTLCVWHSRVWPRSRWTCAWETLTSQLRPSRAFRSLFTSASISSEAIDGTAQASRHETRFPTRASSSAEVRYGSHHVKVMTWCRIRIISLLGRIRITSVCQCHSLLSVFFTVSSRNHVKWWRSHLTWHAVGKELSLRKTQKF